ncbi:hypothetical protein TVAG_026580 [Trichomonas vaginalis G3]|uniref:Uncharacterized protein n=1 Tax=Trichomonas vaginalis (strain ATCC PRA-98 / G3) TaxID=412133 RepID=A2DZ61_TRIV3|nr:spectrin binding [Trichomonas vaginalis G3]EAY14337.1 hypothetical protein TVAG_026580 [Trichomonas vaginalis G3]KAI5517362.1 spectrin binding [Trichomonas vaginalis G3]|eukprot:XP_001326560.1 hypothetical protein [Trichomonas vaginalis G3]
MEDSEPIDLEIDYIHTARNLNDHIRPELWLCTLEPAEIAKKILKHVRIDVKTFSTVCKNGRVTFSSPYVYECVHKTQVICQTPQEILELLDVIHEYLGFKTIDAVKTYIESTLDQNLNNNAILEKKALVEENEQLKFLLEEKSKLLADCTTKIEYHKDLVVKSADYMTQLENLRDISNEQLEELSNKITAKDKEIKELKDQIQKNEKEFNHKYHEAFGMKDKEIDELKRQIEKNKTEAENRYSKAVCERENEIRSLNSINEQLQQNIKTKDNEIKELKEEIQKVKTEMTTKYNNIVSSKDNEIKELKEQLQNKEKEIENKLNTINNEIREVKDKNNKLETSVRMHLSTIEQKDASISQLKSSISSKATEITNQQYKIQKMTTEINKLESNLTASKELDVKRVKEIENMRQKIMNNDVTINELKSTIATKEREIENLRSGTGMNNEDIDYQEELDKLQTLFTDLRVASRGKNIKALNSAKDVLTMIDDAYDADKKTKMKIISTINSQKLPDFIKLFTTIVADK